jgi:hypothetical protein
MPSAPAGDIFRDGEENNVDRADVPRPGHQQREKDPEGILFS